MHSYIEREYRLILETMTIGMRFLCPVRKKFAEEIYQKIREDMLRIMPATEALKEIIRTNPADPDQYLDFESVKASILLHVEEHGDINLEPIKTACTKNEELGFICKKTNKKWKISKDDYLTWVEKRPEKEKRAFTLCLESAQGRRNLASALSNPPPLNEKQQDQNKEKVCAS